MHTVRRDGIRTAFLAGLVAHVKFIQITEHPVFFLSRVSEYAESIGDGKSEEFKESEQKRIMELLENF